MGEEQQAQRPGQLWQPKPSWHASVTVACMAAKLGFAGTKPSGPPMLSCNCSKTMDAALASGDISSSPSTGGTALAWGSLALALALPLHFSFAGALAGLFREGMVAPRHDGTETAQDRSHEPCIKQQVSNMSHASSKLRPSMCQALSPP